jgi:hypothetical protein
MNRFAANLGVVNHASPQATRRARAAPALHGPVDAQVDYSVFGLHARLNTFDP